MRTHVCLAALAVSILAVGCTPELLPGEPDVPSTIFDGVGGDGAAGSLSDGTVTDAEVPEPDVADPDGGELDGAAPDADGQGPGDDVDGSEIEGADADDVSATSDGGADAVITNDVLSPGDDGGEPDGAQDTEEDVADAEEDVADPEADMAGPEEDAATPEVDTGPPEEDIEEPTLEEGTCDSVLGSQTSVGCRFAPIVGNPSSETFMGPLPWAVIVANPGDVPANVTLYDPDGLVIEAAEVLPGVPHVFELDGASSMAFEHQDESGVYDLVMELVSDVPIAAYQFQPYSTSFSATADATILLPQHTWGDNNMVLNADGTGSTWVTIVSLSDDVDIRLRMPDGMAGSSLAGGVVPALMAGEVYQMELDSHQSLRICASPSTDLTGMRIYSGGKPVAVFVGSPGTSLPGPGFIGYNDYLEEQVPPRKAWGSEVAVVKYRPRGNEDDLYRIIADRNGTEVTVTGEYSGSWTLDEGEFAEFLTDGSFMVNASDAVLVGHFMVSSGNCSGPIDPEMWPGMFGGSNNCSGPVSGTAYKASNMGDPAISFCTPVAQYRNDYILVAPYTYAWDVVTLVAPTWAWDTVTIGGLALPEGTAMPGSGDLSFVRMLIDDGANVIESPFAGVGAEVYGYDCRISYAYAGGLSLGAINDPPDEAGD